jgi:hypothetical protein
MTETDFDPELRKASRQAWAALETIHVVSYFAEEPTAAYVALGLHPSLSYFPARAAAMGAVGPGVSEATFYVFAPWLHEKSVPRAWATTTPEQLIAARREGVAAALHRILGEPDVAEALELAREACAGLTTPGRPLYAGHADLDWPEDDLLALWHAASLIREHRGDTHVALLTTTGLGPVEATVLDGVWSGKTRFLIRSRGWTDEEYAAARDALADRGWLDGGALTDAGRQARRDLERRTDDAAAEGWIRLGLDRTRRLAELLAPLGAAVLAADLLPSDLAEALAH